MSEKRGRRPNPNAATREMEPEDGADNGEPIRSLDLAHGEMEKENGPELGTGVVVWASVN